MISIDMLLERLQSAQCMSPAPGEYLLLNQYQQVLASSAQPVVPQKFQRPHEYQWRQGALQLTMAIPDTQLTLVTSSPCCRSRGPCSASHAFPARHPLYGAGALSSLKSRRLNQRLNYLSCHDALTGAFNRHYLVTAGAVGRSGPPVQAGILMFDADHFKRVNDNFGHAVGDRADPAGAHSASLC
ncbi:GGDEF domain-containing protein [Aeromonas sp. A-5]